MEKLKFLFTAFAFLFAAASCGEQATKPVPVQNNSEIERIEFRVSCFCPRQGPEITFTTEKIHYFLGKEYTDSKILPEINIFEPMTQQLWDSLTSSINLTEFMNLSDYYKRNDSSSDPTIYTIEITTINSAVKTVHYEDNSAVDVDAIKELIEIINGVLKKLRSYK